MTTEDEEAPVKTNKAVDFVFIKIPYLLLGSILLFCIGINFANIIGRYVFFHAIFWTEEILAFLVVWAVFIALPSITYRGAHLKMDLFSSTVPSPMREILGGFIAILMLVCSAYIVYQSWQVVMLYWQTGTRTFAVGVPLIIPNLALPIGFTFVIIAVLIRWRSYITGRF